MPPDKPHSLEIAKSLELFTKEISTNTSRIIWTTNNSALQKYLDHFQHVQDSILRSLFQEWRSIVNSEHVTTTVFQFIQALHKCLLFGFA